MWICVIMLERKGEVKLQNVFNLTKLLAGRSSIGEQIQIHIQQIHIHKYKVKYKVKYIMWGNIQNAFWSTSLVAGVVLVGIVPSTASFPPDRVLLHTSVYYICVQKYFHILIFLHFSLCSWLTHILQRILKCGILNLK